MFTGLFNAFEPHVVQYVTIPSLYGYGEIQVQSRKYDDWVHHFHDTVQAQDNFADVTSDSDIHGKCNKLGSDHPEFKEAGGRGMARAKRAMGFLKAASEKAVFGGIRMFKGKEAEFRYIDCKGKKVMETWFEENIGKVFALYRLQGVSKENLVLGTYFRFGPASLINVVVQLWALLPDVFICSVVFFWGTQGFLVSRAKQ